MKYGHIKEELMMKEIAIYHRYLTLFIHFLLILTPQQNKF